MQMQQAPFGKQSVLSDITRLPGGISMKSQADEYRAKAEYCRQMASQVVSPIDKETWLQLAADWSMLASVREQAARDREH
jgi:hypothetical protein